MLQDPRVSDARLILHLLSAPAYLAFSAGPQLKTKRSAFLFLPDTPPLPVFLLPPQARVRYGWISGRAIRDSAYITLNAAQRSASISEKERERKEDRN